MIDPSVELLRRIERLERQDADPDSELGFITATIGVLSPLLTENDVPITTEDDRIIFGEVI